MLFIIHLAQKCQFCTTDFMKNSWAPKAEEQFLLSQRPSIKFDEIDPRAPTCFLPLSPLLEPTADFFLANSFFTSLST